MQFRKVIAGIVTVAMAMSCFGFSALPSNAAVNENNVQLGDVYNDDGVTALDAAYIGYYLNGTYEATERQVTAMDVNQDGLIDSRDATTLLSMLASGTTFQTVEYVYDKPHDNVIAYRRHTCSSTSSSSYDPYTLQRNALASVSESTSEIRGTDTPDNENINCVELIITDYNDTVYHGSGFIVGKNVVATAAHCLYSGGFMKSVQVNVYNANCTSVIATANAVNIHIPENYIVSDNSVNVNYDYGLIYLGNNINWSNYAVDFAVMTDKFMDNEDNDNYLTTSGFTYYNSTYGWRRYYSSGLVTTMSFTSEKPYRFHSEGRLKGGKSGGMVYYEYGNSNKLVTGIGTHTGGTDTYGMRITPTLLRFYLQNNHLS